MPCVIPTNDFRESTVAPSAAIGSCTQNQKVITTHPLSQEILPFVGVDNLERLIPPKVFVVFHFSTLHHIILGEVNLNGTATAKSKQLVFIPTIAVCVHTVDGHPKFIPKFLVGRICATYSFVSFLVINIPFVVFLRLSRSQLHDTAINFYAINLKTHTKRVFTIAADFTANFVLSQYDVSSIFHNNSFMPQKYKSF